jgi:hypothetical protein
MATGLDRERATYLREKRRLIAEALGKYVLIKGDEVLGVYDTQKAAIDDGWKKLGRVPIFTHKIVEVEPPPVYIPRARVDR